MITLLAKPNPLKSEVFRCEVEPGKTVLELLGGDYDQLQVVANDEIVPRENWRTHRPVDGDMLVIVNVPRDFGISEAIAIAAMSALADAGASAAAIVTVGALLMNVVPIALMGAMMGISYGLQSILKPQTPTINSGQGMASRYADLAGGSNQPARFEPFPKLYGKFRITPHLVSNYITQSEGDDQWLLFLLCLGYGPLDIGGGYPVGINRITNTAYDKIYFNPNDPGGSTYLPAGTILHGNTDLDSYTGVRWEIGTWDQISTTTQKKLRPLFVDTYQDTLSVPFSHLPEYEYEGGPLKNNGWYTGDGGPYWHIISTTEDTKEVSCELTFQSMMVMDQNGTDLWVTVRFTVHVRVNGTEPWTLVKFVKDGYYTAKNNDGGEGYIDFAAKSRTPIHCNIYLEFPDSDKYDIKITRASTFIGGGATMMAADCVWTALRSIKDKAEDNGTWRPQSYNGGYDAVLMAVRIKDSAQLNGQLETLSILAYSLLPVYDSDTHEWAYESSRNPAWAYVDALKGPQVQYPIADSQIDLDEMVDWAAYCERETIYYDWYHTGTETLLERIKAIASTGMATWSMVDGRFSVIREFRGTAAPYLDAFRPNQTLTPRNSWGFRFEKNYHKLPHALRVRYIDERNWQENEVIVYDGWHSEAGGDGKDPASRYEILETQGVISHTQAMVYGKYFLNSTRLRPEVYTLEVDFENLVSTRGDCVNISYDTMMVGLQSARIKSLVKNINNQIVGAVLDEEIRMAYDLFEWQQPGDTPPVDYGLNVRIANQAGIDHVVIALVNPTTLQNPLHNSHTVSFASVVTGIAPGDLCVFGELNRETLLAKITNIEYRSDLSASLTLVPAAIALAGPDPDHATWDALINMPPEQINPLPPTITTVTGNGNTVSIASGGIPMTEVWVSWIFPAAFTRPYDQNNPNAVFSQSHVPTDRVEIKYYCEDWTNPNDPQPLDIVHTLTQLGNSLSARLADIPRPVDTVNGIVVPKETRLRIRMRARSIYGRWSIWSAEYIWDVGRNTIFEGSGALPIRVNTIGQWMPYNTINGPYVKRNGLAARRYSYGVFTWSGSGAGKESAKLCKLKLIGVDSDWERGKVMITVSGNITNHSGTITSKYRVVVYRADSASGPWTAIRDLGEENWKNAKIMCQAGPSRTVDIVGTVIDNPGPTETFYCISVKRKRSSSEKSVARLSVVLDEAKTEGEIE